MESPSRLFFSAVSKKSQAPKKLKDSKKNPHLEVTFLLERSKEDDVIFDGRIHQPRVVAEVGANCVGSPHQPSVPQLVLADYPLHTELSLNLAGFWDMAGPVRFLLLSISP